jgi:hypothetical protein
MPARWPPPRYEVRVEFDAPLEFVYRWCTDYTPSDARYEAGRFRRRILAKSAKQVVYEDLDDTPEGWYWTRHVVRLSPPDGWHSDSVGNRREVRLDYRLERLEGDRTRLTLSARRRPAGIGGKNPPKAEWERNVSGSWVKLRRALEREFRTRGARRR